DDRLRVPTLARHARGHGAKGAPLPTLPTLPRRRCPTAPPGRDDSRCDEAIDLEAGRALELALGQLGGQLRIDAALARLAKQIHANDDAAVGGRVVALAALLDEKRADGALPLGRRQR